MRFACCKRLDVLDEAADRLATLSMSTREPSLRIAAVQHDIVWNDRDANFEHLAPHGRARPPAPAPGSCC